MHCGGGLARPNGDWTYWTEFIGAPLVCAEDKRCLLGWSPNGRRDQRAASAERSEAGWSRCRHLERCGSGTTVTLADHP